MILVKGLEGYGILIKFTLGNKFPLFEKHTVLSQDKTASVE